jgi:hypothetical protein
MKGFPNLRQVLSTPMSANSRTRSVNKTSTEFKYDIPMSLDLQNSSVSTSPTKTDFSLYRDIILIEKKLDAKEIELKNLSSYENFSLECDFRYYLEYLNEICLCIRQKDAKLTKSLLRGIVGCERILKKISLRQPEISLKVSPVKLIKTDNFSQTDNEPILDKPLRFCSTPELESIKQLQGTLKKIKVSRITRQLCDLYDSLSQMYTDIPEPTQSPEPEDTEYANPKRIMHLHLNVIKKNINNLLSSTKNELNKKFQEKSCQDDFPSSSTVQVKTLETMLREKESEVTKYKKKYESTSSEKKELEEKMTKINNFYNEVSKQHNQIEIEAVKLKTQNQSSEVLIAALEKNNKFIHDKLDGKTSKLVKAKVRIKELKDMIVRKQQKLYKLQDDLYNVNISWRIAEEKLFEIEKTWERKMGSKFEHRSIDVELLTSRYMIKKDQLDDENDIVLVEENESDVSDNESPEIEALEIIKKSKPSLSSPNHPKPHRNTSKSPASPSPIVPQPKVLSNNSSQINYTINVQDDNHIQTVNATEQEDNDYTNQEDEEESEYYENTDQDLDSESHKLTQKKKTQKKMIKKPEKKNELNPKNSSLTSNKNKSFKVSRNIKDEIEQYDDLDFPSHTQLDSNLITKKPKIPAGKFSEKTSFKKEGGVLRQTFTPNSEYKLERTSGPKLKSHPEYQLNNDESLQKLIKLEQDLSSEVKSSEKLLLSYLSSEEFLSYEKYKQLTAELADTRKLLNVYLYTKSVQCMFNEAERFSSLTQKSSYNQTPDFQSKISDAAYFKSKIDPLQSLKSDPDNMVVLKTVFESETQIDGLSLKEKLEIVKSLKGHKSSRCGELCPHLLRVMRIKWKSKGVPYPIKNILIKSVEL